jgi:hypothetical protein
MMAAVKAEPGKPVAPIELRGWKAIAAHLRIGVRTALEYADDPTLTPAMPVRKIGNSRTSLIIAYSDELDAWWRAIQKPRIVR